MKYTPKEYWRQCVIDYIECMADDNKHKYTSDQIDAVVNQLLNDDHMWTQIDDSIDYYLGRLNYDN